MSTTKERKVAELVEFVARYRGRVHGEVFWLPRWLSEDGQKRLMQIANRDHASRARAFLEGNKP